MDEVNRFDKIAVATPDAEPTLHDAYINGRRSMCVEIAEHLESEARDKEEQAERCRDANRLRMGQLYDRDAGCLRGLAAYVRMKGSV